MKIEISQKYCKGCQICVNICPKKVFSKSKLRNNYGTEMPEASSPENCVACRLCEKMCPDGCIDIEETEEK